MSKILFTQPAEYDLIDIEYYIFTELDSPQAADHIVDGILKMARDLSDFPEKNSLVNDELLADIGVRMTQFDNYNIFYYFDKQKDEVYIIRILYNRRDWQNILK